MRKFVCVGALVMAAAGTCSAVVPNTGPDSTHSWVGVVGGASGTAIARRTVITAKHVGWTTYTIQGHVYTATGRINHPSMDIALLTFSENLPGWHRLGTEAPLGAAISLVGFGHTGTVNASNTGYNVNTSTFGTRRQAPNAVDEFMFIPGYGPTILSYIAVNGDGVCAVGDSGGGFFAGDRLVGVVSFVFSAEEALPDYGFASLNGGVPYFGSGAINLTDPAVRTWVRANMVPSPNNCPADFDQDGFVTGLDFDLYVAAFEAGDLDADFDGDGFVTGIDFDLYVGAFEEGC